MLTGCVWEALRLAKNGIDGQTRGKLRMVTVDWALLWPLYIG